MRAMLMQELDSGAEGLGELPCEALRFLKNQADFKPVQPAGGDAGQTPQAFGIRRGIS